MVDMAVADADGRPKPPVSNYSSGSEVAEESP